MLVIKKIKSIKEVIMHRFFLNKNASLLEPDNIFTHLTTQEKRKLFEVSKQVENGFVVEIGSFVGASACFISAGLGKNSKIICIDTWGNDAMTEGKRNTEEEFDENTKKFEDNIVKVKGYSTNVKNKLLEITPQIDVLFIDGDHSYEGCKADWDLYIDMVKSGGCVVFHDSGWADGVKRVINEEAKPVMRSFETLPNMFLGYIK